MVQVERSATLFALLFNTEGETESYSSIDVM